MRILILGTNYAALKFFEYFKDNKNNDVFSLFSHDKNCIDFRNNQDIVDFCLANEIQLVLITDEDYIISNLSEELNNNNITVFSPSIDAIELVNSKVFAYRFMYVNQIPTSKFFIAEKNSIAFDFIKNSSFPLAIKPDNHNYQEGTLFCETRQKAINIIENLFNSGNKKIILQNYIEGKNITVWTLTDGYQAQIIGTVAKYQNNIAYFKPNLINEELKSKIQETIINPTLKALLEDNREYIGILGFDIIIDNKENTYLVGYNSFFDDISVEFFTQNYKWEEIFENTVIGNVFLNGNLAEISDYMICVRENEKIDFIKAKTKSNLKRILDEMDFKTKDLIEAKKIWKI